MNRTVCGVCAAAMLLWADVRAVLGSEGAAGAAELAQTPSFLQDVVPLLTRLGCNQGACHGKNAGQNGFRLSLRGFAPELDYLSLTRDAAGRRVNPTIPEASSLIQKPLGIAPHEGGKLLRVGSREHSLLLAWIKAGMPGPARDERSVARIEVVPGHSTLMKGDRVQASVVAHYADGQSRDVTWLARFDSNDTGLAEVDAGGQIRAVRHGETAIRASFLDHVAVTIVTIPNPGPLPQELFATRNNFIDDHVFTKLAALRIAPSTLATDEVFIRRVFLDTIGTLPEPDEVRAFLADTRPDKRSRLINQLLGRPEFTDYWTLQLCDLLQNRKERDHDVRGTKGVRAFHAWLREQVAANRPWDALARDILTVRGKTTDHPAVGYFVVTVGEHRQAHQSEVVASVAQSFLGTRIGCAQCHNHPLERYTQDDYYRFAGFFSRIKLERQDPMKGPTTLVVSAADANDNKKPIGVVQPRTGQFVFPRPLDRSELQLLTDEDPRQALAHWVTSPGNSYFSGAMVNRLWKHFLGVGLVEPVDDLRASNPPSNPELWAGLNAEFVKSGFDLKHLIRLILNSRTYQLASETSGGNEADYRFYSHYYVRRLPAEVLLDAVAQATGVPETLAGYPRGVRAIQVPDPGLKSYFLSVFGRSERVTACACERNGEVTIPQLLHLQNGESILGKIKNPEGRLVTQLKAGRDDRALMNELFLATLSRHPTAEEARLILEQCERDPRREDALADLLWALINAKEFVFNH